MEVMRRSPCVDGMARGDHRLDVGQREPVRTPATRYRFRMIAAAVAAPAFPPRCSAAAAISRPASAPLDGAASPAASRPSVRTASSSDGRSRTTPTVSSISRRTCGTAAPRCGRGLRQGRPPRVAPTPRADAGRSLGNPARADDGLQQRVAGQPVGAVQRRSRRPRRRPRGPAPCCGRASSTAMPPMW